MTKTAVMTFLLCVLALVGATGVQAYTEFTKVRCLNLTNNGLVTIPNQTTVNYVMNTQALITNGTLRSDCADIRVIYNYTTRVNWTYGALDFPSSTCNAQNTTVRFLLQRDIAPNATDSLYCIYYNNAQADPLTFSASDLYLFYDDFDRANSNNIGFAVKGGNWTELEDGTDWQLQSSRARLTADDDEINYELLSGQFAYLSSPLMHSGVKVGSQLGSHANDNEVLIIELKPQENDLYFKVLSHNLTVVAESAGEPYIGGHQRIANYTTSTMTDIVQYNLSGTIRYKVNGNILGDVYRDVPQDTLTQYRFELALNDAQQSEVYYIDDVRLWYEPQANTLNIIENQQLPPNCLDVLGTLVCL